MSDVARLDRLKVSNFQSIEEADISLGALTVIVGPSNSGKSALLRALRAVARNVNSPSAVRVGKTSFAASVETNGITVGIERGKGQSKYWTADAEGNEQAYTKAARAVPDDIQRALALPVPDGTPDIAFTSQIDPPFLLSETGSVAAKVIGDLTNVSKLHEAAKESNRRRLEASKVAKIREQDALDCAAAMRDRFSDLHAHAAGVKEARSLLEEVRVKARTRDALSALLRDFEMAEKAERDLRERLDELPKPQDIEDLAAKAGEILAKRQIIQESVSTLLKCAEASEQLAKAMEDAKAEVEDAERRYREVLVIAGTCPTCEQEVKK